MRINSCMQEGKIRNQILLKILKISVFFWIRDSSVCILLSKCLLSNIKDKTKFEKKHKKHFKDEAEIEVKKIEALQKVVGYLAKKSKAAFLKRYFVEQTEQLKAVKVAEIAKKFFTDVDFLKEVFLSCSDILSDDLPNRICLLQPAQQREV